MIDIKNKEEFKGGKGRKGRGEEEKGRKGWEKRRKRRGKEKKKKKGGREKKEIRH
ncbi:hypothetical protein [Enterococcus faecalis]|uniref:hypothetical protein n=1 Tax=Enterococcus faecalis TaxID=1351 RepID=UPI0030C8BE94